MDTSNTDDEAYLIQAEARRSRLSFGCSCSAHHGAGHCIVGRIEHVLVQQMGTFAGGGMKLGALLTRRKVNHLLRGTPTLKGCGGSEAWEIQTEVRETDCFMASKVVPMSFFSHGNWGAGFNQAGFLPPCSCYCWYLDGINSRQGEG